MDRAISSLASLDLRRPRRRSFCGPPAAKGTPPQPGKRVPLTLLERLRQGLVCCSLGRKQLVPMPYHPSVHGLRGKVERTKPRCRRNCDNAGDRPGAAASGHGRTGPAAARRAAGFDVRGFFALIPLTRCSTESYLALAARAIRVTLINPQDPLLSCPLGPAFRGSGRTTARKGGSPRAFPRKERQTADHRCDARKMLTAGRMSGIGAAAGITPQ
jgi:hypothetical protein